MCLIGLLGLIAPRVVFLLLWLFTPAFVLLPFQGLWLVPLLGLILLPTTTLAYCWAFTLGGVSSFSGIFVLAVGLLIDLGLLGAGRGAARR
ncbi:MAG: hypothetical protein DBW85_06650 [Synechococcus sp. MED-G71]|nr:MAG: hypothetical protein DBW85_06650 [Synechococcus sp. MED-G71]RPF75414.1 MAG: hypothetical protein CBD15_008810 [Synechococcus sp. TMED155]|tara:strand:- start:266 stop:538 length:273 start_codon:yes stop_codon:yes gene_type:complete